MSFWWCLVTTTVLVAAIVPATGGQTRNGRRQSKMDPNKFLEKYGYVPRKQTGVQSSPNAQTSGIKHFQRMHGLQTSGVVDQHTMNKMASPRCGMPDMHNGNPLPKPGSKMGQLNTTLGLLPEDYMLPGYMWTKTSLTWRLYNFTATLPQEAQRSAFARAFKFWSDVTPLQFQETTSDSPDIKIHFYLGNHGDGVNIAFDGPGGVLAHAYYPISGEAHFDDAETWTQDSQDGINLMMVATHELGHSLGLGHSNVTTAVLYPTYSGFDPNFHLDPDDIQAIQQLYGSGGSGPAQPTQRPAQSTPHPTTHSTRHASTHSTQRLINTVPPPVQPGSADPCTMNFDGVSVNPNGGYLIFHDKWFYSIRDNAIESGYPKLITDIYPHDTVPVRAVEFSPKTQFTYFFKGKKIVKYRGTELVLSKDVQTPGYPQHVEAAVTDKQGVIYLLVGTEFWVFDEQRMDVSSTTPQLISSKWPGVKEHPAAAVRLTDNYTYFFHGSKYQKFDENTRQVQPGYPKEKAIPWIGAQCGAQAQPKRGLSGNRARTQ